MKHYRGLVVALVIVVLASGVFAAGRIEFDPQTMMRAADVSAGMHGIGKSVFQGTDIEEFEFRVVGRLEKMIYGRDVILAQIVSGAPIDRHAGVIGGMSGSPCYVDGKLLGALAYGWGWQKEALFGITPIEDMIEATWGVTGTGTPADVNGHSGAGAIMAPSASAGAFHDSEAIAMRPLSLPVVCAGMGPAAMQMMEQALAPYGLSPTAGPGTKSDPADVTLQPGSAVGVRLMSGDFDATGIGTVTYKQGDQILAFGHPMMQIGSASMQMCTAWIHDILPSIQRSSKIGAAMKDVGAIYRDSPWSIAGQVGQKVAMIPAKFHIIDHSRDMSRDFSVEVIDQPQLTGSMIASATIAAIQASFTPSYEGTGHFTCRVTGAQGDTVERTNTFYFQGSAVDSLVSELQFPMFALQENRFRPQRIRSVEVTAEFDELDKTAMIERVYVEETVAKAGEPLNVHVVLRPDGAEPTERVVKLNIPIETPKGALRLAVTSGDTAQAMRTRLQLLTPTFSTLNSFIDFYESMERNTDLVVVAALPSTGLIVGQTVLHRLPGVYENIVTSSPRTDLYGGKAELSAIESTPWILYGTEYLALPTADREGAKGATPATPKSKEAVEQASTDSSGFLPMGASAPLTQAWAASVFPMSISNGLRATAVAAGGASASAPRTITAVSVSDEASADAESADEPGNGNGEDETAKDVGQTIARQPSRWIQTEAKEFLEGKAGGVAVRSDGIITLAPRVENLQSTKEFYVLCSATDGDGAVYFGTGSEGHIYRIGADGKAVRFATVGDFAVTGLIYDAQIGLLAATSPGGVIYAIDAAGNATEYCQVPDTYVWDLGRAADGAIIACTGPEGRVYKLDGSESVKQLFDLAQAHVLCMAADEQHTYFGTADQGVVYCTEDGSTYRAVYDAGEQDVTDIQIAPHDDGVIYVSTGSKSQGGSVCRITADGTVTTLYTDKQTSVYSLALMNGDIYAGTGTDGKLICITAEDVYSVAHDSDDMMVTCLQPAGDGLLYAGTTNLGSILLVDTLNATEGWFESSVLDAKRVSRWGRLDWTAQITGSAVASISTRSGCNSDPEDSSWSSWSRALENTSTGMVQSPSARYLQYRLELARRNPEAAISIDRVSVAYLPSNRPPTMKIRKPLEGSVSSGKVSLQWDAADPDGDGQIIVLSYRASASMVWNEISRDAKNGKYEWDTSGIPSGCYCVRVSVTDAPSNPDDALETHAEVTGVLIDNDAPSIWVDSVEARDGRLHVNGVAADEQSHVAEVTYQVKDNWYAAKAADGIYDGQNERFEFSLDVPEQNADIAVRVRDAAGNVSTIIVKWPNGQVVEPLG